MPETRASFWQDKFQKNVARDRANLRDLGQLGWSVMVIWECETTNLEILAARLTGFLDRTAPRSADGNGLQ